MISDSTFYRYTIVIDVFSNEINKTHLKMRPVWFDIFLSLWAKLEYTQTSGYVLLFGRVHVKPKVTPSGLGEDTAYQEPSTRTSLT